MSVSEPYRFFDHTGDFGVEVRGKDRAEVLSGFARAFLHLLTDAPETVAEVDERELELEGLDPADLLVALGNELIYLFEVDGFLAARLSVEEFEDDWLAGTLHGEVYDPERHPMARPVKAVTHHGAALAETDDEVVATIVFDL